MQTTASLFVGALLAFGMIGLVKRRRKEDTTYVYAAALIVAAAIYAAFSMNAGPGEWVLLELAGVVLFGVLAVLGFRKSMAILASGWTLHVGWDIVHQVTDSADFVPAWYPMLCVAFDVVIGIHLFLGWRRSVLAAKS